MRRRPRQLSLQECYGILKLDKDADTAALKRAYRRRAFELHPDLHPDNPEASHDFQLLNEAYVALSAMLEHEEKVRASAEARRAAREASAAEGTHKEEAAGETATDAREDTSAQGATENRAGDRAQGGPRNAYTEHDVLRDLLNDPFARRVFEDIYSELNRQQKDATRQEATRETPPEPPRQEPPRHEAPHQEPRRHEAPHQEPRRAAASRQEAAERVTLHKENIAWGTPKWDKEMSTGVRGIVKGWLRRQIDEEQSITLPAARLAPGRRVRLQIRQALTGELKTIEITLPPDFAPGKAIRLRGLGKRVGPWQGDLYLTISNS